MKAALARNSSRAHWVDAGTAAELLGVKTTTLYAYVSREGLRTMRRPGSKENLYHRDDLQKLAARRRPSEVAQARAERALSLGGGGAVLRTSISTLAAGGPVYRGHLATGLVRAHRSFEDCAELLWQGVLPAHPVQWNPVQAPAALGPFLDVIAGWAPGLGAPRLMALLVDAAAACSRSSPDLKNAPPAEEARRLLQMLATAFRLLAPGAAQVAPSGAQSLAQQIACNCGLTPTPEVLHALNACLILCAEHELAPATFAARVAASAGADTFSCVASALGAFEGTHGVGCDDAEALLRGATSVEAYVASLREQSLSRHPLPGYAHPLYPEGDPRAAVLLEITRDLRESRGGGRLLDAVDAAAAELQLPPNLAVGLAAVVIALRMPAGSAGVLMALGRCAGWLAHVFEQRLSSLPLRPRARYTGPSVAG